MNVPKSPGGRTPYPSASRPLGRPRPATIHDVRPARQTERRAAPAQAAAPPQQQMRAVQSETIAPRVEKVSRRRRFEFGKYGLVIAAPLIIIACVRLSNLPALGQGIIVAYGIVAIMLRIPSRVSFWLAAMALVSVGIEFLLLPQEGRANNGALFVFLLLGVGLACSVLENRRMVAPNKISRRR